MKNGLLLINLGTPKAPAKKEIRKFLAEFLLDKYVIQIPALFRYLLVYGVIIPFRIKKTTNSYQAIWDKDGSPLQIHSQELEKEISASLKDDYIVATGFRYGSPSIKQAYQKLKNTKNLTILPLYPQYSTSTTKSAIQEALRVLKLNKFKGKINIIEDFHQHEHYIKAQARKISPYLENHEYILFSFHSVPTNHILINDCKELCTIKCSEKSSNYNKCYRAQCITTATELVKHLNIPEEKYSISFQSRIGNNKWIGPYTDKILLELRNKGVENLAVTCPSFVADCLETLEEIGITLNKTWKKIGGTKLTLIPALNSDPHWIESLSKIATNSKI